MSCSMNMKKQMCLQAIPYLAIEEKLDLYFFRLSII